MISRVVRLLPLDTAPMDLGLCRPSDQRRVPLEADYYVVRFFREALMSTRTISYLDAVEHLPPEALLVVHDVNWAEYEQLLTDLEPWPGMRATYNKGRLEIMSPSPKHEKIKVFVDNLVAAFCDEKGLAWKISARPPTSGSATSRARNPSCAFMSRNLDQIVGKEKIDPDSDPPPDVVVEIDTTNDSVGKFAIYASFRVPEIWRYHRGRTWMLRLEPQLCRNCLQSFLPRPDRLGLDGFHRTKPRPGTNRCARRVSALGSDSRIRL